MVLKRACAMFSSRENTFTDKFRILNSQEASEEIIWTSSESSDYENTSHTEKKCNLSKRKPVKRKRKNKYPTNISNLDVTIVDSIKYNTQYYLVDKSPISTKLHEETCGWKSPVLQLPFTAKQKLSPYQCQPGNNVTSPILLQKYCSPKLSTTKKKLFKEENNIDLSLDVYKLQTLSEDGSTSPVLKNKTLVYKKNYNSNVENSIEEQLLKDDNELLRKCKTETEDSFSIQKNNKCTDIAKRVRSFFDTNFSSESQTQHTINNSETPETSMKSSEDIEIISSLTQVSKKSSFQSFKLEPVSNEPSPISYETISPTDVPKKKKYKRDGLAYRLDRLLKKHTASVSLWKHEKYLADNSNFMIPKAECLLFHIRNVQFKYGLYLLDARNVNDEKYYILVNSNCVNNDKFLPNTVFKLYEPFNIVDYEKDVKLIVNVSKFENVCMSE